MFVNFNILNQLGSPAINSNTFANRPAAGQTGRLFVSTDTFEIYRDNGTTWDLIGGPGSSTITGTGTATQVAYFTAAQAIGSSANLFWDNTNTRLGVGTATPSHTIEANGAVKADRIYLTGASASNGVLYWTSDRVTLANYNVGGIVLIETNGGVAAATFNSDLTSTFVNGIGTRGYAGNPSYGGLFNGSVGINTATPSAALDIHSTGTIAQLNSTGTTNNGYLAFQRTGTTTFSIGDTYNGGTNYFRIFGNSLSADIVKIFAATGKSSFTSTETYSSGNSIGVAVQHNLTIPNAVNVGLAAIGGVNSNLNLSLGGNTTVAATGRQGLEGSTSINFTGAGTLTMTQGSTVRAFSALGAVYAFNGSAVGTITHLAGLRICFPDNVGSAVNITNNYALLINNQTTGTGTVTYTNRWGIYQEGASDLNYLAANLLIGSTTNSGEALQVTGTAKITSTLTANSLVKSGGTASQILAADGSVITAGTNITIAAGQISSTGGGISGSGTTNYLSKFTAATTVGDSRFFDNGTVTFLGNGDVNASPSTGIFSGTGGTGTNIAGAELRIRGGASTGNAAGGIISFYTSASGSSGSGVNAATERGRFGADGVFTITSGQLNLNTGGANGYISGNTWYGINTGNWVFQAGNASQNFIWQNSVSTERMRLNSSGNLGIGTSTIGSTLQVNGNAAIGYSASTAAPTNGLQVAGATNLNGLVTLGDAINIAVNTTTGTKIGTATSQKLAFWNATPIVQPTTAVTGAARVGGGGATVTDTDTFGGYTIAQVVQALRNTGILA